MRAALLFVFVATACFPIVTESHSERAGLQGMQLADAGADPAQCDGYWTCMFERVMSGLRAGIESLLSVQDVVKAPTQSGQQQQTTVAEPGQLASPVTGDPIPPPPPPPPPTDNAQGGNPIPPPPPPPDKTQDNGPQTAANTPQLSDETPRDAPPPPTDNAQGGNPIPPPPPPPDKTQDNGPQTAANTPQLSDETPRDAPPPPTDNAQDGNPIPPPPASVRLSDGAQNNDPAQAPDTPPPSEEAPGDASAQTLEQTADDDPFPHDELRIVYRSYEISDLIRPNTAFKSALDIHAVDRDAFVQMIVDYAGDKIEQKYLPKEAHHRDYATYITEKGHKESHIHGSIQIREHPDMGGAAGFNYVFLSSGEITPANSSEFVDGLLDRLGVKIQDTDGVSKRVHVSERESYRFTQSIDEVSHVSPQDIIGVSYLFTQSIDDLTIHSNRIHFGFDFRHQTSAISITMENWNHHIDKIDLYDPDEAQRNAWKYVQQFEEFTGPPCEMKLIPYKPSTENDRSPHRYLYMVHDRLVYEVSAATCQNPVPVANYKPGGPEFMMGNLYVVIDAITGKPLFVNRA